MMKKLIIVLLLIPAISVLGQVRLDSIQKYNVDGSQSYLGERIQYIYDINGDLDYIQGISLYSETNSWVNTMLYDYTPEGRLVEHYKIDLYGDGVTDINYRELYQYNASGELDQIGGYTLNSSLVWEDSYRIALNYDAYGRIINEEREGFNSFDASWYWEKTTNYSYQSGNLLSSISYTQQDGVGGMETITHNYYYNIFNDISEVVNGSNKVIYSYDAIGKLTNADIYNYVNYGGPDTYQWRITEGMSFNYNNDNLISIIEYDWDQVPIKQIDFNINNSENNPAVYKDFIYEIDNNSYFGFPQEQLYSTNQIQTSQTYYDYYMTGAGTLEQTHNNLYFYSDISLNNNVIVGNENINVYPLPANDKLFIEADNVLSIDIVALNGRVIKSWTTESNRTFVDVSDLEASAYILRLNYKQKVINKKILINR